jgi:hypothetical protein
MSKFDRNYTKWTKEAIDDFLDDNPSYKKMRKKIEVDEDGSIHIKGTMMIFKNAVTSWKDSRYFTEGKLKLDPRKYKDPKRKDTLAGKLGMKSPRSKKYDKKKNEERMSFDAYLAEDELIELWKQGKLDEAPIQAKGWTQASVSKFGKTIGKDPQEHGFFDACVARMSPKEGFDADKAKRFCASIKDASYGSAYWRGKDKPKKEIEKQTKEKPFKKQLKKK